MMLLRRLMLGAAAVGALALRRRRRPSAKPKVVAGPGYNPECFAPWSADTKYFQWDAKPGPYRIALVNGFVGNTWRIQMIQTAKAFAETPGIKEKIKEFKVISTGTDAAAQLGAIEDFINQGYDAIVTIAVSPEGFDRVIRLADRNGVVIVPFDNILDTDAVMMVNEDQSRDGRDVGRVPAQGAGRRAHRQGPRGARLPGNSVDRDRHLGFHEVMEKEAPNLEIVEIVGNWDDGTARRPPPTRSPCTASSSPHSPRAARPARCARSSMPAIRWCRWRRGRERLPQVHRAVQGQGPQGPVLRPVAGAGRDLDQGGDRALEGNPMPQLISVPIPSPTTTRSRTARTTGRI